MSIYHWLSLIPPFGMLVVAIISLRNQRNRRK